MSEQLERALREVSIGKRPRRRYEFQRRLESMTKEELIEHLSNPL